MGNWKTHYMRLEAKRFISGQGSFDKIFLDLWSLLPNFVWQTNTGTPCIYSQKVNLFVQLLSLVYQSPSYINGKDPTSPVFECGSFINDLSWNLSLKSVYFIYRVASPWEFSEMLIQPANTSAVRVAYLDWQVRALSFSRFLCMTIL